MSCVRARISVPFRIHTQKNSPYIRQCLSKCVLKHQFWYSRELPFDVNLVAIQVIPIEMEICVLDTQWIHTSGRIAFGFLCSSLCEWHSRAFVKLLYQAVVNFVCSRPFNCLAIVVSKPRLECSNLVSKKCTAIIRIVCLLSQNDGLGRE